VVRATYLVLRDGKSFEYKPVLLSTSNNGWKARWFYTENIEDGLFVDIDSPATPNPNWSARPSSDEMHHVEELLDLLPMSKLMELSVLKTSSAGESSPAKKGPIPHMSTGTWTLCEKHRSHGTMKKSTDECQNSSQ
jgi:hypothetical protein